MPETTITITDSEYSLFAEYARLNNISIEEAATKMAKQGLNSMANKSHSSGEVVTFKGLKSD